jgi:hypothetical protein
MGRYDLNISTELELLTEMRSFLYDLGNGVYSHAGIIDLLIEIETAISQNPNNKFLRRFKTFVRDQSQVER